jgi:hypothetical protein
VSRTLWTSSSGAWARLACAKSNYRFATTVRGFRVARPVSGFNILQLVHGTHEWYAGGEIWIQYWHTKKRWLSSGLLYPHACCICADFVPVLFAPSGAVALVLTFELSILARILGTYLYVCNAVEAVALLSHTSTTLFIAAHLVRYHWKYFLIRSLTEQDILSRENDWLEVKYITWHFDCMQVYILLHATASATVKIIRPLFRCFLIHM